MEQNIEKNYVANLLEINKTMRNELEILYSLMRKKLIIEDSEIEYKKKLNDLIFKLETIQINLSSLMKNHNNLIELINDINIKVKKVENEEEKNNKINTYEKEINKINLENEEIKKKNEKLNQENIKLKEEIIENKKGISELSKNNTLLFKENNNLKKEYSKIKKENEDYISILKSMEDLGEKLKKVELKYKEKLEEKDLIINQLDIQLQEYEKKLNLKDSSYDLPLKTLEDDNDEKVEKYFLKNQLTDNTNLKKHSFFDNDDIENNKDNSI